MAGAAAAFALVAVAAGGVTYLVTSDRGDTAPDSDSAGPGRTPSPPTELTAAELYNTSPWPYDITFENGNRIQGELELIEAHDHPQCWAAGMAEAVIIALADCTHRVEAAYRGTVEGTVVSEQVLVFTDGNAAAAFLGRHRETYADDILPFEDPTEIRATDPWTGGWNDGVGRYVVMGVVFGPESLQQTGDDLAARTHETVRYLTTRES